MVEAKKSDDIGMKRGRALPNVRSWDNSRPTAGMAVTAKISQKQTSTARQLMPRATTRDTEDETNGQRP